MLAQPRPSTQSNFSRGISIAYIPCCAPVSLLPDQRPGWCRLSVCPDINLLRLLIHFTAGSQTRSACAVEHTRSHLDDETPVQESVIHVHGRRVRCWRRHYRVFSLPASVRRNDRGVGYIRLRVSPNPPMDGARIAEGGEEVTDATVRARIRVDWRLAGGLSALLGVLIAACDGCGERDGGIGHGKKHSRTGPGASWRGS